LKQNATHIYRLKKILPEGINLKSLVVFVQNNTQYISAENVVNLNGLRKSIKKPKN